jgi:hypothetical protein
VGCVANKSGAKPSEQFEAFSGYAVVEDISVRVNLDNNLKVELTDVSKEPTHRGADAGVTK